ncbi:MAG: 30S ribosomal protein S20 [Actinobacteria bacterium]|nr:30S ribosomal protein S20 [Actinomycetota bacterium]
MANTKSALKMIRVSERRRQHNRPIRSALKTYVSKAVKAAGQADPSAAQSAVHTAIRELDKAAAKGVIHPNNAARRKSRLMKRLNQAGAA